MIKEKVLGDSADNSSADILLEGLELGNMEFTFGLVSIWKC